MEEKEYYSRTLRYQKTATDNAFALLSIIQNSQDEIVKRTFEQLSWMPDYSKQGYTLWSNGCQTTTTTFKEAIDRGYEEVERFFKGADTTKKDEPSEQAKPKTASTQKKKRTTAPSKSTAKPRKSASQTTKAKKTQPKVSSKSTDSSVELPAKPSSDQAIKSESKANTPEMSTTVKTVKPASNSLEKQDAPKSPAQIQKTK